MPRFGDDNQLIGLIHVVRDITERKRSEKSLRVSEAKYRSMMESMTDPVYICSPEFIVEYMNPAMIKRIGRNAIGEKCYSALHDLDAKCDWCLFEKVENSESTEINIVSPKDDKNYRVTSMPVYNDDGTVSKMAIYRDVTDFLKAVAEKEDAQALFQQAQKMESIGTLAGGIAHDFNNILTSIIGYSELALGDVEKGTSLEEYIKEIEFAGDRAKELVKQILAFSRQSEHELKPIIPSQIVKEAIKLMRSATPTTIEIKQNIISDSVIMGDQTQIHQVVMNLCTNAIHAMENAGGTLAVDLNDVKLDGSFTRKYADLAAGNYLKLTVSDTGTGIKPDIIESIFEPYFTTKQPGEGTGLGLPVVNGIIKQFGGEITVESEPGRGSTFSVYLPVSEKRAKAASETLKVLPVGNESILLIDDEAPILNMCRQMLSGLGYKVTTRTSSIESLELFRNRPNDFDLIITDMTMPNMTGDKLSVELLKIRQDIPVILCTGYSKQISEKSAAIMGIKAYAMKPFVLSELANTIRKVLDDAKNTAHHHE